ncbi:MULTISPECIES: hypothetical protein [Sphingomonas]|uniref:hypothetical protein n=1 Tax=Sphingomonas TaxID=13687 RepID=UPI001269BF6E|nr:MULTISPECIES: hypothetical protein [Sphingomonas]
MPELDSIINDDRHYLDEIPGGSSGLESFSYCSEEGIVKLKALTRLIGSWLPEEGEDVGDPVRYIRKAVDDIVWGRGRPWVSLRELASRVDPAEPLRLALLALCHHRDAFADAIGTGQANPEASVVRKRSRKERPHPWSVRDDWPDERGAEGLDGYFIDFHTIDAARNVVRQAGKQCVRRGDMHCLDVIVSIDSLLKKCEPPCIGQVHEVYPDCSELVLFDTRSPTGFSLAQAAD